MTVEGHIIGIDLGTTYSVVALLENEQARVLSNSEGSTRTPSVVAFSDTGPPLVGELARRQSTVNPAKTITSIKRLLGRSFDDIQKLGLRFPFELTSADGQLLVRIGDHGYTPSQISALVLNKLKLTAEEYLGEPVEKAIITVPAYFDDLQRQATVEAGRLAGLEVLRLVNEPTAAAMAYGIDRSGEERIAVYDFGGGTFDLTVLDIANNAFEVLTSVGDTHLGGDDIDSLLVNYMLRCFKQTAGPDYIPDAMAFYRLKEAAEKAKCELSISRLASVHLPFLSYEGGKPLHLEMTVSRDELERMITPLVERTLNCCREALKDCELGVREIDRVILVGGTCRIPLVQDMVEDYFGIPPFKGVNPDEIVAMGAAMQGGVLGGKLKEVILLDVTPHSLGVEVADNKVVKVIEKNSTIPIKAAKLFTTTDDAQEMVVVHVSQGEEEKVSANRSLGKFTLTGIQKAKSGVPRIQVTFYINADGMVEVSAEDLATREQKALSLAITGEPLPESSDRGRRRRPRPSTHHGEEVIPGASPAHSRDMQNRIAVHRGEAPGFQPLIQDHDTALRPRKLEPSPTPLPAIAMTAPSSTPVSHEDAYEITPTANLPFSTGTKSALDLLLTRDTGDSAKIAYSEALAEIQNHVARNPNDGHALEWAVRILLFLGRTDEARSSLTNLMKCEQRSNLAMLSLSDQMLGNRPGDTLAIQARANALAELGRADDAIALLEPVCAEERATDELLGQLVRHYEAKLAMGADDSVEFNLVKLLIRLGRLDEAINILQRLCQSASVRSRALKILGLCFWQKGMHYLAWQKFQQLTLTEEVKDILYRLAADMEDTDQLVNAKCVLQHVTGNDPGYRDVILRLERLSRLILSQGAEAGTAEILALEAAFKESRFVIIEEINRGSMGIVYRAKDKVLDEVVALKVLNDYLASDPTAVERFKREARAAKRLSHTNIVRIHDMFEIGTKKLLSMEYISGKDLKKVLQERKSLPAAEIVEITLGVCEALACAHKSKIVHRDVKPANIMITDTNQIKVTDFGIAKILLAGPEVTRTGSQVIGTPLYMSPEQIRGDHVDERSDIYSLGTMMYEMASGKPPFVEGNIEYHHLHTEPAPIQAELPIELAESILRCLQKEPANRFQSIGELRAVLAAISD
jgi:molecular chaperone DnaK